MNGETVMIRCSTCDDQIDRCEFCERPDCATALCYGCVIEALGQAIRQPHDHGG